MFVGIGCIGWSCVGWGMGFVVVVFGVFGLWLVGFFVGFVKGW